MPAEVSIPKDVQTYRTRKRIKAAARKLFADRGVNAVTIRDIVKAAGQKNVGAIHYHFQSKDALIQEIALEVGRVIDANRNRLLDFAEAEGGPTSVKDAVRIMVAFPERTKARNAVDDVSLRLVNTLFIEYRDLLFGARLDRGEMPSTSRLLAHISRLLPEIPTAVLRQRYAFAELASMVMLGARELAEQEPEWRTIWHNPATPENMIESIAGMLAATPSAEVVAGVEAVPPPEPHSI